MGLLFENQHVVESTPRRVRTGHEASYYPIDGAGRTDGLSLVETGKSMGTGLRTQ